MISQLVTLLGVLVGALTSYLSTTVAERARHRRMLETRWDERKLNVYVEYAAVVKEAGRAAGRARKEQDQELRQQALAEMEDAEKRRSLVFESMALLADPSAFAAAHEVNRVLWQWLRVARDPDCATVPTGTALIEALNTLHERARRDLGVTGAHPDGAERM
ncbi:hypothetical protein [Streptomyces angustmyceticus]|uniref:hypothetical protein n=1 Tax=Streptomyces angustmyceticus TaxID=285578 RepID=UPI003813C093